MHKQKLQCQCRRFWEETTRRQKPERSGCEETSAARSVTVNYLARTWRCWTPRPGDSFWKPNLPDRKFRVCGVVKEFFVTDPFTLGKNISSDKGACAWFLAVLLLSFIFFQNSCGNERKHVVFCCFFSEIFFPFVPCQSLFFFLFNFSFESCLLAFSASLKKKIMNATVNFGCLCKNMEIHFALCDFLSTG